MKLTSRKLAAALLLSSLPVACGGDDATAPPPASAAPPAPLASLLLEGGVRRELLSIPGAEAQPNPTSGEATPVALNAARFVRYREDASPPRPARAILIAMPGLFLGAGALEPLAAALVRRGAASGETVEVWAIERRANALEDRRGVEAAEAAEDPEIARRYYLDGETLDGEAFAGFEGQGTMGYASEWGLAVHAEDTRALVQLVGEADRRGHVFLMGHSLGGWFAESYAAFRFEDGVRGFDELAGVVLIDGVRPGVAITEAQYEDEGVSVSGLDLPALSALRAGAPLIGAEPITGTAWTDLLALRARLAPDEIADDAERDTVLAPGLGLDAASLPAMTNAAALGFFYDDQYQPNYAVHVGLGDATGGPVETYAAESPFGTVQSSRPSDPSATYTWVDAPDLASPERVPMRVYSEAWTHGGTNGVEWYFPARLMLDIVAVLGNAVPEDGYQAAAGLRVFDGPRDDAPFLVIAASFPASAYTPVRGRIAPAVGPGRPHAGADRSSELGFQVVTTQMAHTESIMASDGPDNPIPAAIEAFVAAHAEPGTVAIPGL